MAYPRGGGGAGGERPPENNIKKFFFELNILNKKKSLGTVPKSTKQAVKGCVGSGDNKIFVRIIFSVLQIVLCVQHEEEEEAKSLLGLNKRENDQCTMQVATSLNDDNDAI